MLEEFVLACIALQVNVRANVVNIDNKAKAVKLFNHCVDFLGEGLKLDVVNEQQCQLFVKLAGMATGKVNGVLLAALLVCCDSIIAVHCQALIVHQLLSC